jgi:hypothetical protein
MARIQYLLTVGGGGGQGGGSVISHRHILTSAFPLAQTFTVLNIWLGGITRTTQRQVFYQRRLQHPQYQQTPRLNDIGIIFLNNDIIFDRFVQPIILPAVDAPQLNEQVIVLGFGGIPGNANREHLEAAFVRVAAPTRCVTEFPSSLVAQQFCGEDTRVRTDFCSDDIGGPTVVSSRGTDVLVGIASVPRCVADNQPSVPSLYTRTRAFRGWILAETGV